MNNIKSFKNIIIVFSSLAASLFLLSCDGSQIASVEQAVGLDQTIGHGRQTQEKTGIVE